jgi:glycosyltransferase involved in cell wall biosynthesis
MIPTYNCARFLEETIRGVLDQDPGPERMQIEVVDDGSSDDPEGVVARVGDGRVGFFRQDRNVGHTRNFDTCLLRSRGDLVHLLHGDDAVRPGFYERLERPFEDPAVGAAFSRQLIVDEDGNWRTVSRLLEPTSGILDDWLERIGTRQLLQTPAMVVRRSVYEAVGGFDRRIERYGEDWEMWVRVAAHSLVWHETEPLAVYRLRSQSLSDGVVRSGKNVDDLLRVVEINRETLPPTMRESITHAARVDIATSSLRRARRLLAEDEPGAARAQARAALRASTSVRVLEHAVVFWLLSLRKSVGRGRRRSARR